MELLAHRGWWHPAGSQNDLDTLLLALEKGHGLETDIRDRAGTVVLSHDPAMEDSCPLQELVQGASRRPRGGTIALNVKADGLAGACTTLLSPIRDRCFFFDMSVPDMRDYLRAKLPVFTRQSDVERDPVLYAESAGVWIDEFDRDWVTAPIIEAHLRRGKKVALVSPELHGRDPRRLWDLAKAYTHMPAVLLCTDLMAEAQRFFGLGEV